ncbi:MAG: ATP-binding cassette domain-containing protein [Bacilli bacterium]|nr:ATP-binding cassette domain-containing protein [Bacilli bacterium]MDD3896032.1 ATP-binding cassette domain-containing protein [Bacilli bacterium]MDD4408018.1 ATP-binding cassette domain-containing protein [Bacilli bacterium]
MELIFKNVSKAYTNKKVVNNISFELKKPTIFGFLGTNGAGKTTSIRMLLGIIKKDSGEITLDGKPVNRKNINFGYMPEERGLYPKITVYNQLMFFSELKGINKKAADTSIKYWLEKLNMMEYFNMEAEKLSKGNQQKIQFILAVMNDPSLIVLDEPFSGLDPVNTEQLKNVILDLVKQGKYIIMSSHQMNQIEEFCSDILILDRGKCVLQGNLKEIKDNYETNNVEIITNENIENYLKQLKLTNYNKVNNNYLINIKTKDEGLELFDILVKNKIELIKYELKKPSLHDIFIERVGK